METTQNKVKNILPDFLIVGAAKSGTTSLVKYLDEHPNIYTYPFKEPKYLSYKVLENGYQGPGDFSTEKHIIKTLKDYYKIFENAKKDQRVCEASVDTLYYYKTTIPQIKELMGDPEIIIMLRNPVKRAISAYSHLIREERENLPFREALNKEKERIDLGYEFIWAYKDAGRYYESVKAFKNAFSNVKVVIFEDFVKDRHKVVYDVLDFLKIKEKHDFKDSQHNKSGVPKNVILNKFLINKNPIKSMIKKLIGRKNGKLIRNYIQKINLKQIDVPNEDKDYLHDYFLEDINKLEALLQKDLTLWKKNRTNER